MDVQYSIDMEKYFSLILMKSIICVIPDIVMNWVASLALNLIWGKIILQNKDSISSRMRTLLMLTV